MISFWFNDVQFTCLTSYTSNTLIAKAENFDLREKKCSKIDLKITTAESYGLLTKSMICYPRSTKNLIETRLKEHIRA